MEKLKGWGEGTKERTSHSHTFMVTNFQNHKNEPSLKGSQSFNQTWQTPHPLWKQ